MSPYRRSPRPIGLALDRVQVAWEPQSLLGEIQRVWREVVGSVIATEARPTRERAGVLTVSCSASVWAQELDLMGPSIVQRLNEKLLSGAISRLRCIADAQSP